VLFIFAGQFANSSARAENKLPKGAVIVKAGDTFTLPQDLELTGDAVLEIRGTPEKRCVLAGNNHRIKTKHPWTGQLKLAHCDIQKLGTNDEHALSLAVSGSGEIAIENCTFDESGSVHIVHLDNSDVRFCHNLVRENSLVPSVKLIDKSRSFLVTEG